MGGFALKWGIQVTIQDKGVGSLSWEDPLVKEMATHSRILAWRITRTEEPGGLQSMRSNIVEHDWAINTENNYGGPLSQITSPTQVAAFSTFSGC